MARKTNDAGIKLITEFEGVRLDVYKDPIGLPTVGVGHLVKPGDNLKVGDRITAERAAELLRADLAEAENAVGKLVKVPLSDNEFAACVSLTFNIGAGNFGKSTLLRLLNQGDRKGASMQFSQWKRAGGRVLPGLVRRREAERSLFVTP